MIISESFLHCGLDTLVTFNPICIYPDTKLDDLLERLYTTGFHHWPVIDVNRCLMGIVSDEDIVRIATERHAAIEAAPGSAGLQSIEVAEFMNSPVISIDSGGRPIDALKMLLKKGFHSIPVVRDGSMWALITSSDFVREFAMSTHSARQIPISWIAETDPLVVDSQDNLETLRMKFVAKNASYAVVLQGDCPLGIVSGRDLRRQKCRSMARTLFDGNSPQEMKAIDIVGAVGRLMPNANLAAAANIMYENHSQAVMVVSKSHELQGIVTQEQVLFCLCESELQDQELQLKPR